MPAVNFGKWAPDHPDIGETPHVIDAKNVIPTANHYRPLPGLTVTTDALNSRCIGAVALRDIDGAVHMFAGSTTKLYQLDGAVWTDYSLGAGVYTTANDNTRWRFTAYGDRAIAVNGLDAPQYIDMSTAATAFANLAGSPGAARFVATFGEFIVLGSLSTSVMAIKWSALGDSEGWTAGVGQSDEQEFADGGQVTGLVPLKNSLFIFQEKCIRRMTYVGGATIMRIDKITEEIGCIEPNSLAYWGQRVFFLSEDGWYAFNGESEPVAIGLDVFSQWFLDESSRTYWYASSAVIDPKNHLLACAFVSADSGGTVPNRILFFNYDTGWATYAEVSTEILVHAQAVFTSIDDLSGNLDADYDISFDDPFWLGGAFYFAAFNTDHKLASFSGDNLEATLQISPFPLADGRRASVEWLKPIADTTAATMAAGSQVRPGDAIAFQSAVSQQTSGRCPQRGANGFYMAAKLVIPAAEDWTYARGIEFMARANGGVR